MTAVTRRIPVVLFAFLAANLAATLIITLGMWFEWDEILRASVTPAGRLAFGVFGFIMPAKVLVVALLLLALAEHFRIRALLIYAAVGGIGFAALAFALGVPASASQSATLIGRQHEIMIGAGIAGGFVYWAIAGRNAGAWQDAGEGMRN